MQKVYEPLDAAQLPQTSELVPNIEIVEGVVMLVYRDGVAFGMVNPQEPSAILMMPFETFRQVMINRAKKDNS